ncbi:MAG: LPXTG cell wall anchor domain-containing protein [Candidatus Microsaccharimonas sp.]
MSTLTSLIHRAPKRFSAVVAMIAAAVIVPAAVLAWGPARETYTIAHPADHVVFNSITDNPVHGDERNFVQVKEATASNSTYAENVSVTPGKQYTVFVYYHNNAASNLNASGKGIATGAYAKVQIPAVVAKGSTGTKAVGYVGAANANPGEVWDDISFSNATAGDIALRYVPGSAHIYNKGATNGATLSDSIITTGAKLGYKDLDGVIPGCNEFSGYVTFNVQADQPNFELSKQVRVAGTTEWKESVDAKPGATVEYQLRYANTGTTAQNNVVLKDTLPTNVSYVPGSTYLKNTIYTTPKLLSDNLTTSTGINIGNYAAGSVAYVKFSAKVNAEDSKFCTPQTLRNVARVETNNGTKQDTADVVVKTDKDCKPPVKYTCDSLTVKTLTKTSFRFTTAYSVQNATFKNVVYTIRNESGAVVDTKTSTSQVLDYVQTTPGKYTVQATVTVTVDGQDKTVTSDKCKGAFEVPKEEKKITVCELATYKIVTIKESDFDPTKYSKDLKACEKITVCELATKKIVTIRATDFDPAKYSKNLDDCKTPEKIVVCELATKKIVTIDKNDFDPKKYSKNLDDCKVPETIIVCELATKTIVTINKDDFDSTKYSKDLKDCDTPEKITVCELATKTIVTINKSDFNETKYSADLTKCETPVTPPELPKTGAGENIVAVTGLGAIVAAVAYYIASRRALGL